MTDRFGGCTVELRVPDFRAGVEFYLRLFGRRPDFEPHRDFVDTLEREERRAELHRLQAEHQLASRVLTTKKSRRRGDRSSRGR